MHACEENILEIFRCLAIEDTYVRKINVLFFCRYTLKYFKLKLLRNIYVNILYTFPSCFAGDFKKASRVVIKIIKCIS